MGKSWYNGRMDGLSEPANEVAIEAVGVVSLAPAHDGGPGGAARRELAYRLWAWEHGQNAAAVARDLGLSPRAVQKWAAADGWDARLNAEAGAVRDRLVATNARRLLFGSGRVLAMLERTALGQGDDGLPATPPIPWQARVHAAKAYLGIAGYPEARGAAAPPPAPAVAAPATLPDALPVPDEDEEDPIAAIMAGVG